ncbi:hypothetical protein CPC08DRAFT_705608, partial [Agrocybe pediades]
MTSYYYAEPIPSYPWTPSCDPYINPHIQVLSYHAPPPAPMTPPAASAAYPYYFGASCYSHAPVHPTFYSSALPYGRPGAMHSGNGKPPHLTLGTDTRKFTSRLAEFVLSEVGIVSSAPSSPSSSTTDGSSVFSQSTELTFMSSSSPTIGEQDLTCHSSPSPCLSTDELPSSISSTCSSDDSCAAERAPGTPNSVSTSASSNFFLSLKRDRPSAAARVRMARALGDQYQLPWFELASPEDDVCESIEPFDVQSWRREVGRSLQKASTGAQSKLTTKAEVERALDCEAGDLDFCCRG